MFRFLLPESRNSALSKSYSEIADDYNSYAPVSIAFKHVATESEIIDGVKVTSVVEADLLEISILSKAPAISSTYARVASWETCCGLQEDYELGRFELVGNYVSLHRTIKARENNGVVKYNHATSPYDRAADNFQKALRKLGG